MSWKEILKEDLTEQIREALMLMGDKKYTEDTILHHGATREGIANIIDDLEVAIASSNFDDKEDAGMPKAVAALKRI